MSADIVNQVKANRPSLRIYGQSDPEFPDLRRVYNGALPHQPLAIARPHTESDVSTVLDFCSRRDIPVTARSGGHDFFGRCLTDGIVLDMRSMDSVIVSPDRNTARVGGGVIGADVQDKLDKKALFTPTGQTKSVGYVSWACGGGYGFYAGSYGLGVDQIVGARVVLSNGEVVDTDDDPELLWALRGAGAGTFGVVVELRVKVYPIPKLYAGFLAFPLSDAEAVLDGYDRLRSDEGIPDGCSGDCLVANPHMLGVNDSGPCYAFYFCYAAKHGDLRPGKTFLGKLAKLGNVVGDTVEETKPVLFGGGDSSSPTFFRSRNVRGLNKTIGAILARNPLTQPWSNVVIHHIHGKGAEGSFVDAIGGVFPNRFDHVILGFHGGTRQEPRTDQDALAQTTVWAMNMEQEVDRSGEVIKGGFTSFHPPGAVDPVGFFGEEAAARLSVLKKRLDPDGVFHIGMPGLLA